MEHQPENPMTEAEKNMLLVEYGKILLKRAEGEASDISEADTERMTEIEAALGLDSQKAAEEAYRYLGSSVRS